MFTGIVEERGAVREVGSSRLAITCATVNADSDVGASVAVNGVCLTVVERGPEHLAFDLSEETVRRTSFSRLAQGDLVNLERPLTLSSRLGGHLVQGHVDGVGTVTGFETDETGGAWLTVTAPEDLRRYLVEKGSVCVDGVSLTVAALVGDSFSVALIPHTLDVTTLGVTHVGDPVNLEVDVIAKYVEALMDGRRA
ncbi:MAG: riboflavin synthase subunit alpha [Actinobacteria bacterium RBG_19FT_COMBO_70_19]|nr:MAG: riboflavin synthase subunit alpha [Actinobacteria bacterium RBG_19FT_COMBO_70_19]